MNTAPSVSKQLINCNSVLKFQNKATKNEKLSILLVGQSEFCHLISECIYSVSLQNEKIELTISKSESIENVLKSTSSLHIDFIIFLINTAQRHYIEQVERNISLVESLYLCDRMILVNGSNHLNPADMGLSYDELFNLSQKYRLHIFNGNVKNEENCLALTKRMLNFIITTCGLKTGLPMILEFPSNKFPVY